MCLLLVALTIFLLSVSHILTFASLRIRQQYLNGAVPNDLRGMVYDHLILLPVVLTTAELYIPKFDKKSLVKGEIDQKDFELGPPRKWLTYDLPLPDYLSYQVSRPENSLITVEKLTVFIVNADSLEEFFEKSCEARTIEDVPQK